MSPLLIPTHHLSPEPEPEATARMRELRWVTLEPALRLTQYACRLTATVTSGVL
jgi:hypothetical protein